MRNNIHTYIHTYTPRCTRPTYEQQYNRGEEKEKNKVRGEEEEDEGDQRTKLEQGGRKLAVDKERESCFRGLL